MLKSILKMDGKYVFFLGLDSGINLMRKSQNKAQTYKMVSPREGGGMEDISEKDDLKESAKENN